MFILTKVALQLLRMPLPLDTREVRRQVADARTLLQRIRSHDIVQPHAQSPARLAFDPRISRRLACFMPVRTIDLPPQEQAWDTLSHFLDGWEELSCMLDTACVSTWEVKCLPARLFIGSYSVQIAGYLRLCSPQKEIYPAYLRSLSQVCATCSLAACAKDSRSIVCSLRQGGRPRKVSTNVVGRSLLLRVCRPPVRFGALENLHP